MYEYQFVPVRDLNTDRKKSDTFNKLGSEGWVYCGYDQYNHYVFVRRIDAT